VADVRRGENKRESWWVRNLTNNTITIGDLLLFPALKPGKRADLLHYYTREKVSHSKVLVKLVKARIVSLDKDKIYANEFPGPITSADIDEAITPGEENEITKIIDDLKHNDTNDIQGGSVEDYYHLTQNQHNTLTGGSYADSLHTHNIDDLTVLHNNLEGLQGGDPSADEFYHLSTGEVDKISTIISLIVPGQEVTDDTDGAILYGKDPEDTAQAVGISGEENDEVQTMDLDLETLLEDIYLELIKANIQMSIITGNHIKNKDIDGMQEN